MHLEEERFQMGACSVHDICLSLGPWAKALTIFHSFTGCDTVSANCGKRKKVCMVSLECV